MTIGSKNIVAKVQFLLLFIWQTIVISSMSTDLITFKLSIKTEKRDEIEAQTDISTNSLLVFFAFVFSPLLTTLQKVVKKIVNVITSHKLRTSYQYLMLILN